MEPYYNSHNYKEVSMNHNKNENEFHSLKLNTVNFNSSDQYSCENSQYETDNTTPTERNTIYISLQNYNARSPNEINIEYNEHLKLIQNKNNGYLLVQSIKKPRNIGLVASKMVEILDLFDDFEDSYTPKRHYSTSSKQSNFENASNGNANSCEIFDNLSPISVLNTPLSSIYSPQKQWENFELYNPLNIQKVHVLDIQCNWAKLEILYSDDRRKVLKRFFSDFKELKNSYYYINMRNQLSFQSSTEINNYIYELLSKLSDFAYFENWIIPKLGDYDSSIYNCDDSLISENILSSPKLCIPHSSRANTSSTFFNDNYNTEYSPMNNNNINYSPMKNNGYYQTNNNINTTPMSNNYSPMNSSYSSDIGYGNYANYNTPLSYNNSPAPVYNSKHNNPTLVIGTSVTSTPTKLRNKNLPPIPPPKSTPLKRPKINIISPFNSIENEEQSKIANVKSNIEIMKEIELEMENQQPQHMSIATKFYNTYKVKDKVRFKVFYNDGNDIFMMKVSSEIKIEELKALIFKRLVEEFKKYQNPILKRMTNKDVLYIYNKGAEGVYNPIKEDSILRNIIDNSVNKITLRAEVD